MMHSISSLPYNVQRSIFLYLSYDEISHSRQICKSWNDICSSLLNSGFRSACAMHKDITKFVKAQLPRRESERRGHPLARHVDTLSALHTRLSLLSMTFGKHMDEKALCFFPGKVLDEVFRLLRFLKNTNVADSPRAIDLLSDLRDYSSMAMEYFEENLAPFLNRAKPSPSPMLGSLPSSRYRRDIFGINNLTQQMSDIVVKLRREMKEMKTVQTAQFTRLNRRTLRLSWELKTKEERLKRLEQRVRCRDRKIMQLNMHLRKLQAAAMSQTQQPNEPAASGSTVTTDRVSSRQDDSCAEPCVNEKRNIDCDKELSSIVKLRKRRAINRSEHSACIKKTKT